MTQTAPSGTYSALARLAPQVSIVFFGFLAIGLPLPALPHFVHDTLGFGPIVVGWAVGLQSLVTVITRPIGGALVDARGPKASVLFGLPCAVIAGAAYLAAAFGASAPLASLALLFVGRVLLGFAESFFLTGTMTWGIARMGIGATGQVMAWQGIAMYAALGLGAPAGVALQRGPGFAAVAVAVIALPLIGLAVAARTPAAEWTSRRGSGSLFQVLGLVWPQGVAVALGAAPFPAMAAFLPLHFTAQGWGGAGLALLLFAAGYIGVRLFLAHLPDRMGGSRVAIVSLVVEAVGQLILWRASAEPVAIVGALVTGMGFSLVYPSFGVQAMRKAPAEVRGLAVSAFMAFFDVSLGLTGPAAGFIAARFGYAAVFLAGAFAVGAAILVAAAARPRGGAQALA